MNAAEIDDDRALSSRPELLIFDVNETLSDMAPLAGRFEEVGVAPGLAETWFAEVLRDGFALAASGDSAAFALLTAEALRVRLEGYQLNRAVPDAVSHIVAGFAELAVHADVAEGIGALSESGVRLITLSNGSTSVAEALLERAGLRDRFERLLSVEDADAWKPAKGAYTYALAECRARAADAMLVAVHPWDIHGAQRAGLSGAWLNRRASRYPTYFDAPQVTVSSLLELADALR